MADDLLLQLAQQQSMIAAAAGGNGQKPVALLACVGIVNGTVDVGAGLTLNGRGLNSQKTFNVIAPPRGNKWFDKIGASILEDCKKALQAAGAVYAGNATNGAPVSNGLPVSSGQDFGIST